MSQSRRGAPSGPRRGQTQRIASGARSAPYARPELQHSDSRGSFREPEPSSREQWPPNQLSIRGVSGPTWIIVANLLRGTTDADIRETFRQFGEIEDVRTRRAPSENHPSIAFEIAFTQRAAANVAVEKLDGALADGRLLQVSLRDGNKFAPMSPAATASAQTPPIASASASRELFPTIPSGPRAQQRASNNNGRELLQPRSQQLAPSTPKAPKAAKKPIMQPSSLQSRIMSAAELKNLQKKQARAGLKTKSLPGVPTGPKGTVATPATSSTIPLAKRITMPLAMRLTEEAKRSGPASGQTPTGPAKKRKAKGKSRAKNANGMEVD